MGPEAYYGSPTPQQVGDPNKIKRIIIASAGIFVFLVVIALVFVMIFSKPSLRSDIGKVVAREEEVIRVSDLALGSNRASQTSQNLAATAKSTALSSSFELQGIANDSYGDPLSKSILASNKDSTSDEALTKSEANNTFNDEFLSILENLINGVITEATSLEKKAVDDKRLQNVLTNLKESHIQVLESIR